MEKININTKLYTLDEVYDKFNHSHAYCVLSGLKEIAVELDNQVSYLYENSERLDTERTFNLIDQIETQLLYLNRNIRVFEDALLCHETKMYEVRNILGENTRIWLN